MALCALAPLLAACHTYTPVNSAPPGSQVRVRVPVSSVLDDPNAPRRTVSVEGTVVEDGDTVRLATRSRQDLGAFRGELVRYDTLALSPEQRSSMELVEFSTTRSVALGVGLAAAITVVGIAAFTGGGGEENGGSQPGPIGDEPTVISSSMLSNLWSLVFGN